MNKLKADQLIQDTMTALQAMIDAGDYGDISVNRASGGRFDDLSISFKIEFREAKVEGGVTVTKEAQAFLDHCTYLGLQTEDLGREFSHPSLGSCRVIGYKPRNRKFPMIVEQKESGKRYKLAFMDVRGYLKGDA